MLGKTLINLGEELKGKIIWYIWLKSTFSYKKLLGFSRISCDLCLLDYMVQKYFLSHLSPTILIDKSIKGLGILK